MKHRNAIAGGFWLVPVVSALGADGSVASPPGMTWQQILQSGGWVLYVLGAMSVLALALVVYLAVVLRPRQVIPPGFLKDLLARLRAGHFEDARRLCDVHASPIAEITRVGLDYVRGVPEVDSQLVKDIIEGEGCRQADAINGQTQYLLDVGVIAPMLGLLGTVFGMLRAFSAVAYDIAKAKPVVLAYGVSQALVTTAAGLLLGIPAMAFYAYFRRRAADTVSELESSSVSVLTAMLTGFGAQGGRPRPPETRP